MRRSLSLCLAIVAAGVTTVVLAQPAQGLTCVVQEVAVPIQQEPVEIRFCPTNG